MDIIDAPESDYLYTNASQLSKAGMGLFTAIEIHKGEIVAVYKGEILSAATAKLRAETNQDHYFINMPDGTILDSLTSKCFARYANDAAGFVNSGHKNNAKILLDDNQRVCLVATRKIKCGEEIFCSYGKKYWKKHG